MAEKIRKPSFTRFKIKMDKEKRESELARMLAESTFIHGGD